jgi:hypothetical protein
VALFTEEFVRYDRDGGGVKATAQIRPSRTTTAKPAADGFAKEAEEVTGVLFVPTVTDFFGEIEIPIAAFLDAARSHPHEVGSRKTEDVPPEGLFTMSNLCGEILGHHAFVGRSLYPRIVKKLMKL